MTFLEQIVSTLNKTYDTTGADASVFRWALEDYSETTIAEAVKRHIKASKWYPKPAELVTLCEEIDRYRQDQGSDRLAYWNAMDNFNASLRGDIDEDALLQSRPWQWYERRRVLVGAPEAVSV